MVTLLVIQGMAKLGKFQGCQETTCSHTKPSALLYDPASNMIYFYTSFKKPQILQEGGHAHDRHPCQV